MPYDVVLITMYLDRRGLEWKEKMTVRNKSKRAIPDELQLKCRICRQTFDAAPQQATVPHIHQGSVDGRESTGETPTKPDSMTSCLSYNLKSSRAQK